VQVRHSAFIFHAVFNQTLIHYFRVVDDRSCRRARPTFAGIEPINRH